MPEDSLCISFIDNGGARGAFAYCLADTLIQLREDINISHILRWSGSSIIMNRYRTLTETDVKALASAIDEKIRYIKNNPVVDTELAKSTQEKFSWAECKRQWLELDEKIGTLL